jgi:hypothetical protein
MATTRRRRGKGLGTVYRRGQLWSIAWVAKGVKQYEHGFPDEDTARRVLSVKIGDLAAGRGGLQTPKPSGPLAGLVEEWLNVRRTTRRSADQDENRWHRSSRLSRVVVAATGGGLLGVDGRSRSIRQELTFSPKPVAGDPNLRGRAREALSGAPERRLIDLPHVSQGTVIPVGDDLQALIEIARGLEPGEPRGVGFGLAFHP